MTHGRTTSGGWILQVVLCLVPLAPCGCANKGAGGQPAAGRADGASVSGGGPGHARPSALPVAGTLWLLSDLGGAPPVAPAEPDPSNRPRLQLDASVMRVSGATGLNLMNGPYEAPGGDALKFGLLATTRRAGPPELTTQESAFLAALDSTAAARVTGTSLRLFDDAGKELARFEPASGAP
jgi:heat shock protein HslJ